MRTRGRPDWLEDGEEILWSGGASIPLAVVRALARLLLVLGVAYVAIRITVASFPVYGTLEDLLSRLYREQPIPVVVAALLLAAAPFALLFRLVGHTYAITDRRLVAWRRGGKLAWSLPPDLVLDVGRGWLLAAADVRFNRTVIRGGSDRTRYRWNAFACLGEAGAVAERVARWQEARQDDLRESLRDQTAVRSEAGGFSVRVPRSWEVRTYRLEAAQHAGLLTPLEDSQTSAAELAEGGDWNALVLSGPWRTSLTIESYPGMVPAEFGAGRTEPPSWLVGLLGATEEEREADARLGGLSGERVRMTIAGTRMEGPSRHQAAYVQDTWILQGEKRWHRINALWSAALPAGEEVVRQVAASLESSTAFWRR